MSSLDETLKALDELLQATTLATLPQAPCSGLAGADFQPPPQSCPTDSRFSSLPGSGSFMLPPAHDLPPPEAYDTGDMYPRDEALSPVPSFTSLGSEEVRKSLDELDAVIEAFDQEYREVKTQFRMETSQYGPDSLARSATPTELLQLEEEVDSVSIMLHRQSNEVDPHWEPANLPPPAPLSEDQHEVSSIASSNLLPPPAEAPAEMRHNKPPPPKRSPHTKLSVLVGANSLSEVPSEDGNHVNDEKRSSSSSEVQTPPEAPTTNGEIDTASRSVSDILKQFSSLKKSQDAPPPTASTAGASLGRRRTSDTPPGKSHAGVKSVTPSNHRPVDTSSSPGHHPSSKAENIYSVPAPVLGSLLPAPPQSFMAPSNPQPPPPPPPPATFCDVTSGHLHNNNNSMDKRRSGPPPAPPKRTVSVKPDVQEAPPAPAPPPPPPPPPPVPVVTRKITFAPPTQVSTPPLAVKNAGGSKKITQEETVLHSAMVNQLRNGVQLKKVTSVAVPTVVVAAKEKSVPESSVNNIDGYIRIPDDCPDWKRAMLEKKNKEALENYRRQQEAEEKERRKWEGIPDWKRQLLEAKIKKDDDGTKPANSADPATNQGRGKIEEDEWKLRSLAMQKMAAGMDA